MYTIEKINKNRTKEKRDNFFFFRSSPDSIREKKSRSILFVALMFPNSGKSDKTVFHNKKEGKKAEEGLWYVWQSVLLT